MYIEFFLIIIIVILLFDYNNVFRRKKIVSKTIEEKDSFNWLKEKIMIFFIAFVMGNTQIQDKECLDEFNIFL